MDAPRKTEPGPYERQVFGIRVLRPSHPRLRELRRHHTPSYQGHKLWNATWLLLSYLEKHKPAQPVNIMEVGCGWGLASVYCARVCAATVTSVDLDPQVFPFLELNVEVNEVNIQHFSGGFDRVETAMLEKQEVVIGADICFRSSMVQPLFDLIARACRAGTRRIVLSDPGRMAFRNLASRCVDELGATQMSWQVEEPLLSWPGDAPLIHGRLLVIDK
jgi:predicted nicotinamide N-methyase